MRFVYIIRVWCLWIFSIHCIRTKMPIETVQTASSIQFPISLYRTFFMQAIGSINSIRSFVVADIVYSIMAVFRRFLMQLINNKSIKEGENPVSLAEIIVYYESVSLPKSLYMKG